MRRYDNSKKYEWQLGDAGERGSPPKPVQPGKYSAGCASSLQIRRMTTPMDVALSSLFALRSTQYPTDVLHSGP
jgi:hypothetical protein